MKTVSEVLGVARSNLQIRARRSTEWTDGRRHRQPGDAKNQTKKTKRLLVQRVD